MKKLFVLPLIMAVCMAEYGAGAAPRGRAGAGAGAGNTAAAKPAAAAKPNGARAANMQKTVGAAQKPAGVAAKPSTGAAAAKPNGARAAATQKAIKMGTKVSTAVENTVVSNECQTAYYGCMDAFCMLDNASGGRCQCNDKISELDDILAEIMKLDEQSLQYATEGVEKVQMGELADKINARAKSIENEYMTKEERIKVQATGESAKAAKRTLDLSAWNNNSIFSDDDDDDIFGDATAKEPEIKIADDLANKKGDELHKAAAKICTQQIPEQCKANASMLQMTYAQKIRSDCTGYENALKQQRTASIQKLQTAQKAVRDALLEDEKNKNKYEDLGSCVAAFDKCMQSTAGCKTDYTGCVADDTVLTMGTDGSKGKTVTAAVQTSASAIGISANTLAILTDKAPLCESVLKQCQNVRNGVWNAFLKMIVPTLKSAEVNAEKDRRTNCISTIVDCFTNACAAKWPDQESAEYDMCLSNPDIVSNLCQIQINQCSTGSTGEQVMEYVKAKLQAMRVDACTKEVKDCLQSENNCGEGYVNCIGLDKDQIVKMCTNSATNYKLMACQSKFNNNQFEVQNYVAQVAQGLILNMDNAALKQCEEAAETAVKKFCGSTTECKGEKVAQNTAFSDADGLGKDLVYKYCSVNPRTGTINYNNCFTNASALNYKDLEKNAWDTVLFNHVNFSCFKFNDGTIDVNAESVIDLGMKEDMTEEEKAKLAAEAEKEKQRMQKAAIPSFSIQWNAACRWGSQGMVSSTEANRIAAMLTQRVQNILGKIETNTTIKQCVLGRDLKGITTYENTDGKVEENANKALEELWTMKSTSGIGKGAFPNLMTQYRQIIADAVLNSASDKYSSHYDVFVNNNSAKAEKALEDRIAAIGKELADIEKSNALMDNQNAASCMKIMTSRLNVNDNASLFNNANAHVRSNVQRNRNGGYWGSSNAAKRESWWWEVKLVEGGKNEYMEDVSAAYDYTNHRCKVTTTRYKCNDYNKDGDWCKGFYRNNPTSSTKYQTYSNIKSASTARKYN